MYEVIKNRSVTDATENKKARLVNCPIANEVKDCCSCAWFAQEETNCWMVVGMQRLYVISLHLMELNKK